jgi:hypothetical protein
MRMKLPLALALAALVVAALGWTSFGEAARYVRLRVTFAKNAGKVNGIKASRKPKAGRLFPLGKGGKFPASVLPNGGTEIIIEDQVSGRELVKGAPSSGGPAFATCPSGKTVVSGGATVGGDSRGVVLQSSYPASADRWEATAIDTDGAGGWTLTAFAICATA